MIISRFWAAVSPAWRGLYKAVFMYCLPLGLKQPYGQLYRFCTVDSRFSIIWRISTIFFRGLWEDFLASAAHKRNCGKVVEDFHQA